MSSLFMWHTPAVKKLLGFRIGSEEEKWAEKAVDSLVKKLKKKKSGPGTIEELEFALANPTARSSCVTIPKSLDGRLQVSHKKGLPHVIYCKVWRWPDLQSHQELRAIPECMYPYDQKQQHICINPYHYQRIDNPSRFQPSFMQPSPPQVHPAYSSSPYSSIPSSMSSMSSSTSGAYAMPCSSVSPPLSMISPSQMGSPHGSNYGSPIASSYHTATSPSSVLSDDDVEMKVHVQRAMVPPSLPIYWATILYYELNNRVGDTFKLFKKTQIVDGFTDPTNDDGRICIGAMSNINRNSVVEGTRKSIGKGLQLTCSHDYTIMLHNLSEGPIFVQSRNLNLAMGVNPNHVARIPPGGLAAIFDNNLFNMKLSSAVKEGYSALHDLQKICFIRISFVKGWGAEYPRHDITSTPCWIELQLHQPMAWIDQNLHMMTPPLEEANSILIETGTCPVVQIHLSKKQKILAEKPLQNR